MDELWQRYRMFWTPVLIGIGVFLVGVIAVHIISDNPAVAKQRMKKAQGKLTKMKMPDRGKAAVIKERGEALKVETRVWAQRIDQTGAKPGEEAIAAATQALRASFLRGAPDDVAKRPALLKAMFEDDAVAAGKAYKRFQQAVSVHTDLLRSGDPNVAWSRLLSDVWSDLRVRANRADVEIGPAAEQLGFGAISSVSRATLTARVLNLALIARVVDVAIRSGVEAIDQLHVPTTIDPGAPQAFIVLWPVEVTLLGDLAAVKQVLDLLTDPAHPVPLDGTRFTQPKRAAQGQTGLVQFSFRASSVIVRPDVSLGLDVEEDQ